MNEIKERPIIFSSEMVRAILNNRKSQTRRIIKPQPIDILPMKVPNEWVTLDTINPHHGKIIKCPYGIPGDILWVRETWCPVDDTEYDGEKWVDYSATPRYAEPGVSHPAGWENSPDDDLGALHWRPSVFMPRWASRITLEIINVCAERVQDISEEDAKAEGIDVLKVNVPDPESGFNVGDPLESYRDVFAWYWNKLNAKRGFGWDNNPFVWCISFKIMGY